MKVLRERDALRDKRAAVVAAVKEALADAAKMIRIPPVPPANPPFFEGPEHSQKTRNREVAVLLCSDWQLGKRTPTYDSDVCAKRIQTLAEKTIKLAALQSRNHLVTECRLILAGDIVEGEGIFPAQAHTIDSSLYRQVAVNGPQILVGLIRRLLTFFQTVRVVGVIGNHGEIRLRNGPADPEANADRILYKHVQNIFEYGGGDAYAKRLSFDIPDGGGERNWFAVERVFDWGFLVFHGDQIRGGFAGFPWYGAAKKAWGWIDSIPQSWDYGLFGHWHTPTYMTLNRRILICNGSTESDNTYAQEQLAASGYPTQWLGFVNPEHGITAQYWVNLEPRTPNARRGALPPTWK